MNTIECINKEYENQSMGELQDFIGCMIKSDLTKMTLNVYQHYLINNMTQGFNEEMKSPINFNTPNSPHKGMVSNQ